MKCELEIQPPIPPHSAYFFEIGSLSEGTKDKNFEKVESAQGCCQNPGHFDEVGFDTLSKLF
jgi:hypothetical protein